ncbi:apolipoprotein N-acyltransferase [Brevirhabdus sp.]|uniref:apolipoprotein N-acyltransferase n=1 Tax=Brevirhabdus sp. TaxID=2004514 RepID=UPI0040580446
MRSLKGILADLPSGRRQTLFALSGGLAALGQAPYSLMPVSLAGMLLALVLFAGSRRPGWSGWLFATAYFMVSLSWLVEPFLIDLARNGWMAPFALIGTAGGLALIYAFYFRLAHWLRPSPFLMALAVVAADLTRSYWLTGFPWALFAYGWVDWPALQWAAWIGPHGLNLITLLALAAIAAVLVDWRGGWRAVGGLALAVAALAVVALAGLLRPVPPLAAAMAEAEAADRPVVRLIQPNAPQHLKWDPEWIPVFYKRQLDYTAARLQGRPAPDLIVWPETSFPGAIRSASDIPPEIVDAADGVPVIFGSFLETAEGFYNGAVAMGPDGSIVDTYRKHHLVPFGEYLPFASLFEKFGLQALASLAPGGMDSGPGPRTLDLTSTGHSALGRVLPLICYEAIFPQDLRVDGPRPDWLLQITNDAWFGRFSGPYQHLAQTRFRAVEQGLPLLRAANTGVSAVIDASGRVLRSLELGGEGFIDARLPAPRAAPLYARTGDWPVLAALIAAWFGALGLRLRRQQDRQQDRRRARNSVDVATDAP